jgi:hypothetical protein
MGYLSLSNRTDQLFKPLGDAMTTGRGASADAGAPAPERPPQAIPGGRRRTGKVRGRWPRVPDRRSRQTNRGRHAAVHPPPNVALIMLNYSGGTPPRSPWPRRTQPLPRRAAVGRGSPEAAPLHQPQADLLRSAVLRHRETAGFIDIAHDLLLSYREKNRLLSSTTARWIDGSRISSDAISRIWRWIESRPCPFNPSSWIGTAGPRAVRPRRQRRLHSDIISSYRVAQGVLHNPASDRRTTEGSFHVAEGGLPIPGDKKAVPKAVFARMLEAALDPPEDLLTIPFTANHSANRRACSSRSCCARCLPGGARPSRRRTWRSASSPRATWSPTWISSRASSATAAIPICRDDAALDVEHWSGAHRLRAARPAPDASHQAGPRLPHRDDATERQRAEGMCWRDPDERYNDGNAFKITARDASGVIVTILADNYFGYCKKEVKTQISFAANLFGLAEEEHAGGALAFPRFNHGEEFGVDQRHARARLQLRRRRRALRRDHGSAAGGLRDRQTLPASDLCPQNCAWTCSRSASPGITRATRAPSGCSRTRSTSSPTATRSRCRNIRARPPGV